MNLQVSTCNQIIRLAVLWSETCYPSIYCKRPQSVNHFDDIALIFNRSVFFSQLNFKNLLVKQSHCPMHNSLTVEA